MTKPKLLIEKVKSKIKNTFISKEEQFFNTEFYKLKNPDLKNYEGSLYSHYKKFGLKEGRMPHPLFDPLFYNKMYLNNNVNVSPLDHYFKNKGINLNPHPLFDYKYYFDQVPSFELKDLTPLEHYIKIGWKNGLSPSPYFDHDYYLSTYPDIKEAKINPLIHFLTYGEEEFRQPNNNFNPKDFAKPRKPKDWNYMAYKNRSKLSFNVIQNEYRSIDLFDKISLSVNQSLKEEDKSLLKNIQKRFDLIFDSNYYLEVNTDLIDSDINLYWHYLNHGYQEGRFPHPLVDPHYIRSKYLNNNQSIEPLSYLLSHSDNYIDPHPLFNTKYYKNQVKDLKLKPGTTYLEHFLSTGYKEKLSPTPLFDPQFYLESNPDINFPEANPLLHYIRYGEKLGLKPAVDFDPAKFEKYDFDGHRNYMSYKNESKLSIISRGKKLRIASTLEQLDLNIGKLDSKNPTLIFVSHNASRTGAPLIILKIAKYIQKLFDCNCITLLCDGGDLLPEFERLGPTYILENYNQLAYKENNAAKENIRELLNIISNYSPICAYVNSAESRRINQYLKDKNIPVISLVHEMGDLYPKGEYDSLVNFSDLIVFPSKAVYKKAVINTNIPNNKFVISGQGLLKEELLTQDKEQNRNILLDTYNLPKDAKVILGCGTVDCRKGVDYFVSSAIHFFTTYKNTNNVFFIWLGGSLSSVDKNVDTTINKWLAYDIKNVGLEEQILFVGKHKNTYPYFLGADIFFMTSRADPFPCVIHEAMAAELPIVGFQDSGGFVEAVDKSCSIILDYSNTATASEAIYKLVKDKPLAIKMGAAALKRVKEKYDYTNYVLRLCENYLDIVERTNLNENNSNYFITEFKERLETKSNTSTKKNVIFTMPNWQISGVNTVIENQIKYLNEHTDFKAWILFTTNYSIDLADNLMPEVPYTFLTDKEMSFHDSWKEITTYLESNAPCVFFPNCDYIASAISPNLSNEVGICGVLHSDDMEHYEHGYRLGLYWNKIVSVSKLVHDNMLKYNPSFATKSHVVKNGIEIKSDGYPKKNDIFTICYTGRVVQYQKRILDFIPIVEHLEKLETEYKLIIIGDGPDFFDLESGLMPYIEAAKVEMLGRQDMDVVHKILSESHAFLLTSEFEGMPMSVLEALSWYCVPVVTDIKSGIGNILTHEQNSLISPIGDCEDIASNIDKLSKDKALIDELGRNAFETLEQEKLRITDMGKAYETLLNEIFDDIHNENYAREKPLVFNSPTGNILLPPYLQTV